MAASCPAAGTKWNFLPFRPGLVGGHCIGVDPYYLTYKAEQLGYHPDMILAGRRINDNMAQYVVSQIVKRMLKQRIHERLALFRSKLFALFSVRHFSYLRVLACANLHFISMMHCQLYVKPTAVKRVKSAANRMPTREQASVGMRWPAWVLASKGRKTRACPLY